MLISFCLCSSYPKFLLLQCFASLSSFSFDPFFFFACTFHVLLFFSSRFLWSISILLPSDILWFHLPISFVVFPLVCLFWLHSVILLVQPSWGKDAILSAILHFILRWASFQHLSLFSSCVLLLLLCFFWCFRSNLLLQFRLCRFLHLYLPGRRRHCPGHNLSSVLNLLLFLHQWHSAILLPLEWNFPGGNHTSPIWTRSVSTWSGQMHFSAIALNCSLECILASNIPENGVRTANSWMAEHNASTYLSDLPMAPLISTVQLFRLLIFTDLPQGVSPYNVGGDRNRVFSMSVAATPRRRKLSTKTFIFRNLHTTPLTNMYRVDFRFRLCCSSPIWQQTSTKILPKTKKRFEMTRLHFLNILSLPTTEKNIR